MPRRAFSQFPTSFSTSARGSTSERRIWLAQMVPVYST
jgi:hypothetical protein